MCTSGGRALKMAAMENWDAIFSYANEEVCGFWTSRPPFYPLDFFIVQMCVEFRRPAMCTFCARAKRILLRWINAIHSVTIFIYANEVVWGFEAAAPPFCLEVHLIRIMYVKIWSYSVFTFGWGALRLSTMRNSGRHFHLCKWGSLVLQNCWSTLLSCR